MFEHEDTDNQTSNEGAHVLSNLSRRVVECIGPAFLSFWQSQPGITSDILCLEEEDDVEDTASTVFDEDDVTFLRSLDPKLWKHQDHYAVLGLSKLRHKATDEDIKRAYRIKVLHHHPDKRKAKGEEIRREDDYFTCITKAWEILGNPRNRRSFDSVDPEFDDEIPSNNDYSKSNFYTVFGKAFDKNSRWSERQPVPKLGDANSTREQVEKFYSFWYNFESWREYSYLDEEEKEKGQAREERRWIDKQNKAARARRKKDEMTRIRSLVDLAYDLDPRVQKFKQEDKDRKLAVKQARKDAARARVEEEERKVREVEEAARKVREEMEAEEKAKQDAIKAERDAQKKALKKEKTALRKLVKANNYYVMEDKETVKHMASLEKICECLGVEDLAVLMKSLSLNGREAYLKAIHEVDQRIEKERRELMDKTKRQNGNDSERGKAGSAPWSQEQLQLLIKAVNIFPAGTNQRWEVVANFINQHNSVEAASRTAKEVLGKAKDLQSSDYSRNLLKTAANEKAYDNFEKVQKGNVDVNVATSQRFDGPAEQGAPWTAKEQQLLEQALKSYPASTPDRWDRIAECVPSRSKKECLKRFRDLAEMVKAKKAAQAATLKGK
ncbi:dnaJ homolog subfamily C member 2 [Bacillus rossius redtenbacheri]|uniref:dnaJ homolog subfamily C member 2 n=1 Tax=Bacillus rossius redtenbacheri TaxID=93214 RepID=UPI002FDEA476